MLGSSIHATVASLEVASVGCGHFSPCGEHWFPVLLVVGGVSTWILMAMVSQCHEDTLSLGGLPLTLGFRGEGWFGSCRFCVCWPSGWTFPSGHSHWAVPIWTLVHLPSLLWMTSDCAELFITHILHPVFVNSALLSQPYVNSAFIFGFQVSGGCLFFIHLACCTVLSLLFGTSLMVDITGPGSIPYFSSE